MGFCSLKRILYHNDQCFSCLSGKTYKTSEKETFESTEQVEDKERAKQIIKEQQAKADVNASIHVNTVQINTKPPQIEDISDEEGEEDLTNLMFGGGKKQSKSSRIHPLSSGNLASHIPSPMHEGQSVRSAPHQWGQQSVAPHQWGQQSVAPQQWGPQSPPQQYDQQSVARSSAHAHSVKSPPKVDTASQLAQMLAAKKTKENTILQGTAMEMSSGSMKVAMVVCCIYFYVKFKRQLL